MDKHLCETDVEHNLVYTNCEMGLGHYLFAIYKGLIYFVGIIYHLLQLN